jgi:alpha-tubulin suppressor-like RCC1 family protein
LVANNGSSSVLSPREINSTNYPSLTGTPLLATTASDGGGSDEQSVLLTTTGLFAWGKENIIIANALTTNTSFQKLTINSKADGLPTGVVPADVRMLFAMNNTLAILTSTGNAYVISKGSVKVLGDGTTSLDANWHQVKTAVNTPLTNIVAIRGHVSSATEGALMALTSDNKIYTWGETIYKGDGNNSTNATYAVEMTLPSGASGTPKMIGVTGGTNTSGKNSYFILYTSGSLYSLGLNDLKQLGDRTTTEQKSWVTVKDPSGNPFSNVKTISLQEHDSKIPAGALITNDGKLYVWGQGEGICLGV